MTNSMFAEFTFILTATLNPIAPQFILLVYTVDSLVAKALLNLKKDYYNIKEKVL